MGQCFFVNVSLFTLSMVTIKIFIYLFIYYSKPGLLNAILLKFLDKTCPNFFVRDCMWRKKNNFLEN
jgi:hypothetical protein